MGGGIRVRAGTAAVIGALLVSGAAGCSGDDSGLPEPVDPPATPPPAEEVVELSEEEQEAVDGARAAFDAFMTAYNEILTAGEPATDEVLSRILPYAIGEVRSAAHGELFDNFQEDRRLEGRVEWTFAEIVGIDLGHIYTHGSDEYAVPLVWLRYCVDATNWTTVDKETGEPAAQGERRLIEQPAGRDMVTVEVDYFDPAPVEGEERQPTWRVAVWDEEDEPC